MKAVILQSNYFPWKGYFELINECDLFCFYDEVQYTKNDWRNRNKIIGKNGDFWLTVPISKKSVKGKISDVKITENHWQKKHYDSISHAYSKSPFKDSILDLLKPIYLEKNWEELSELNKTIIKTICSYIGINAVFKDSKNFELKEERVNRLVDLASQLNATSYLSGPSAKNYLSEKENLFLEKGISVEYKEYGPYLTYPNFNKDQVSILDVLVNVPRSEVLNYVTSLKK